MNQRREVRVAVNGYGVIGKRVAEAVAKQVDMTLVGVSDIETDWRPRMATRHGFRLFGAASTDAEAMHAAGAVVSGTLDDLLGETDVVVDCTPKKVAAKNIETYRRRGVRFILQGGEKHEATGHSFVAESSYATAGSGRARASSPATRPLLFAPFPPLSGRASSKEHAERCCAGQLTHGRAITAAS